MDYSDYDSSSNMNEENSNCDDEEFCSFDGYFGTMVPPCIFCDRYLGEGYLPVEYTEDIEDESRMPGAPPHGMPGGGGHGNPPPQPPHGMPGGGGHGNPPPQPPHGMPGGGGHGNPPPQPPHGMPGGGGHGNPLPQPPHGMPGGGGHGNPPQGPPPKVPGGFYEQGKHGPNVKMVDPGSIRPCVYRFVYIWPKMGRGFWAWLTFVGRNSVSGYRWDGYRWIGFGMDLRQIDSFVCY